MTDQPDPLAAFRALADRYARHAAEQDRYAAASTIDEVRPVQWGLAAGWRSAEFLLRHTLADLDNPAASGGAEVCCGCGGSPVTYENYRGQLLCAHCCECDCGLPDGQCTVAVCPDCAVRPGDLHQDGCDVARCPTTGKQRLTCDQGDDRCRSWCRTRWTGRLPEPATADGADPADDAAAHQLLVQICHMYDYTPPDPGVRIGVADLADIDRMTRDGVPFGEAVHDVIRLAAWRTQEADAVPTEAVAPAGEPRDSELEQLRAAVARARALHAPVDTMAGRVCEGCMSCDPFEAFPWPCPTIQALNNPEPPTWT